MRPSGRKTYIVKYRDRGRAVKVTIGPHGAISPAAARARAAEIVTAARTGKDLSGRDLRDSRAPTVAELGRRFLDESVTDHCKPNTKRQYRKMVEGYILPRLGTRRVPDVQRIDVVSLHHDMRATPDERQPDARDAVADVRGGRALADPPGRLQPVSEHQAFSGRASRAVSLGRGIQPPGRSPEGGRTGGSERPSATAAIRLLMLTGCRKAEILTLRWEYVDLDRGEMRLPDSKTGAKIVHLDDPAITVLRGLTREDGNPWVITSPKPGEPLSDVYDQWHRIRCRAGIKDVRLHDLRHSYASGGLLVGEGLTMIGKLLGHNKEETTARYAHLANDPLKAAANRIASRIADIAG